MSSFVSHIVATSGVSRGYENVRAVREVDGEHSWVGAPTADPVVHGPFTMVLTDATNVASTRRSRRAGIPSAVVAVLHPGPRTVGTIITVEAAWLPSNVGTITRAADVTDNFPVHYFIMGSTVEAPPQGYKVPIPEEMDLPAWSAQSSAHPVLHITVHHNTTTGGARTTTGAFLRVELTGRVDTYGGF